MENREYYTPEIDELFVGYECEIFAWAKSGDEGIQEKWRRSTLSEVSIRKDFGNIPEGMKAVSDVLSEQKLRTPYLNKSDIESLGWKYNKQKSEGNTIWNHFYIAEVWELSIPRKGTMFDNGKHHLQIWYRNLNNDSMHGHNYSIKSKNELKKLMQWLQIPVKS